MQRKAGHAPTFESVAYQAVQLGLDDKRRLWELLEETLAQTEEAEWERDPVFASEIRQARADYVAGDYVTLEDYLAREARRAE